MNTVAEVIARLQTLPPDAECDALFRRHVQEALGSRTLLHAWWWSLAEEARAMIRTVDHEGRVDPGKAHAIVTAWRAYLAGLHPATEHLAHECNDYLEDVHWAELERLVNQAVP